MSNPQTAGNSKSKAGSETHRGNERRVSGSLAGRQLTGRWRESDRKGRRRQSYKLKPSIYAIYYNSKLNYTDITGLMTVPLLIYGFHNGVTIYH